MRLPMRLIAVSGLRGQWMNCPPSQADALIVVGSGVPDGLVSGRPPARWIDSLADLPAALAPFDQPAVLEDAVA